MCYYAIQQVASTQLPQDQLVAIYVTSTRSRTRSTSKLINTLSNSNSNIISKIYYYYRIGLCYSQFS
jgi:hypothetical protein